MEKIAESLWDFVSSEERTCVVWRSKALHSCVAEAG